VRSKNRSRWRLRGLSIAAAAIVAGLLVLTPIGNEFEETVGLQVLFRLRGPVATPPNVIIVAIDRASAAALDLTAEPRSWPRAIHARLVDTLSRYGASAIIFDLLFADQGKPEDDAELVRMLRKAGNVVLLRGLERRSLPAGEDDTRPAIVIDAATEPSDGLGEAAAAVAPFPLPRVPAQVTRFWAFRPETDMPTLPAVALQLSARDIAGDWTHLLSSELDIPKDPLSWTTNQIVASMSDLRRIVRQRPEVVERIKEHLSTTDQGKAARLRALLTLYEGEDSRLLNFRGPSGTIRTIEYSATLDGTPEQREAAAREVAGKVVVIGEDERDAVRHADSYDTVFSGARGINLAGVEILATATADLLESASLRLSSMASLLVVTVTGLLLGLAASVARTSALAAAALLLPIAIVVAAYQAFVTSHLIMALAVPVAIEVPIGILFAVWWLRLEERHRRISIDDAVRQYLPEEVARSLEWGPLRTSALPPGETRYAICLATDVKGFTTLAERLSPEALGQLLNEYLHVLFEVIQRHGGIIENVTGDGLMSVWTTTRDVRNARASAAIAAVQIRDAVAQFNIRHPAFQLPTRIGLHAGTVLIGAFGGAGHYTATVVGDVANTASRVEALNKHLNTRLLASEEALENVGGLILRRLGGFVLAGKSQPVQIVEILGPAGDARATAFANRFAAAMAAYRERRWEEATHGFNDLLQEYPDDGPSAFFLKRTLMSSQAPPDSAGELVVKMEDK